MSVQENGTSPAVAIVATFLGAGEVQCIAENFEQALPRFGEELDRFVVERRSDVNFLGHGKPRVEFIIYVLEFLSQKLLLRTLDSFGKRPLHQHADKVGAKLRRPAHIADRRRDLLRQFTRLGKRRIRRRFARQPSTRFGSEFRGRGDGT